MTWFPWVSSIDQPIVADKRQRIVKEVGASFAWASTLLYNQHPEDGHIVDSESQNMSRLSISLLGSFQIVLDDRTVARFGTGKARALLAYLAVERDRPHQRDRLAGLLWAESPRARARQSLRQALCHLRQVLSDQERESPFLLVDHETVQFNPGGDYWLDVAEFTRLDETCRRHRHHQLGRCEPCLQRLAGMADLYGGDFMGDFSLRDGQAFEEWAALQREYLQRRLMEALVLLTEHHDRSGNTKQAIEIAHRQVQIQPWREEAHRHLMRLLATDGQRSAALIQYDTCRRTLAQELGVEPTAETTALYEQIRDQSP
jgi:DNA-binding SARP family transcriptional activator